MTCGGPEPKHDANAVRSVALPQPLQSVGSYAFYNCRRLKTLTLSSAVTDFGGGALMNCRALREVRLYADPSSPTCLYKLLGEYAGELDVRFFWNGTVLLPALPRLFRRTWKRSRPRISSSGASTARATATANALTAARFSTHQYDRALSGLLERHDFLVAARVTIRRLATPFGLSDAARATCLDLPARPRRHARPPLRRRGRKRGAHLPAVARCAVSS